jgi:hypothetical protein
MLGWNRSAYEAQRNDRFVVSFSFVSSVIMASNPNPVPYPPSAAPRISRDIKEKNNLANRREHFVRYDNITIANPLNIQSNSPLYSNDGERFNYRQHAQLNKQEQLQQREKYEAYIANKRVSSYNREEKHWEDMKLNNQKELDRINKNSSNVNKTKTNSSSIPFNLITLEYNHNTAGNSLQHHDDIIKYKAGLRSQTLRIKGNSQFNPITGEAIKMFPVPDKPKPITS